jgi:hypothetical protein
MRLITSVYSIMRDHFMLVDIASVATTHVGIAFSANSDDSGSWLVVFTPDDRAPGGVQLLDELNFVSFHLDMDRKPFFWDNFAHGEWQTREQVKERLTNLGFVANTIDHAYPKPTN